jgi:hypothetical protein
MKKLLVFVFTTGIMTAFTAPRTSAQDHVEIGAFADYFRWHASEGSNANLFGVGGRFSVNIFPVVQLEGEVAYDFSQAFTEGFTNPSTGTVTFNTSNLRVLHGMFGPKLQTNKGPVRLFVTAKGGAMSFQFDPRPVTFGTFTSSVGDLRTSNLNAVFYPGGGVEGFFGPIGLRLDIGDEIYFDGGAHNNLRVTFGPTIRF